MLQKERILLNGNIRIKINPLPEFDSGSGLIRKIGDFHPDKTNVFFIFLQSFLKPILRLF